MNLKNKTILMNLLKIIAEIRGGYISRGSGDKQLCTEINDWNHLKGKRSQVVKPFCFSWAVELASSYSPSPVNLG